MRVMDRMFGSHSENLRRAMSRTSDRAGLLAGNLANVNTPGYKRKDVDFAIELEDRSGGPKGLDRLAAEGPQNDRTSVRIDGSSVDLEKEVMAMAETEMRFQLLSDMTSRHFSGLKNVIREGR
jgi:flagellar basal-body rod protein FlgB